MVPRGGLSHTPINMSKIKCLTPPQMRSLYHPIVSTSIYQIGRAVAGPFFSALGWC